VHQLTGLRQPDRPGQPPLALLVLRHEVGAAEPVQLDAVLQQPLQPVGGAEVVPVPASDVPV